MKILYIVPYNNGGMLHYAAELANAVSKYAEVFVISGRDVKSNYFSSNVKLMKEIDALEFSLTNPVKLFNLKNLMRSISFNENYLIKKLNPNIIHITTPLIPPLPIIIFHDRIDKVFPLVYSKHCIVPIDNFTINFFIKILTEFEKFFEFTRIFVHTQKDKNDLIKINNKSMDKIAVIPHGSRSLFQKCRSNVLPEKNCVLFFGAIRKYKGLDYLIKAAPLISNKIENFKILIAGEGKFSEYSRLIEETNSSIFEIHNYYLSDSEVSALFQRSELVVLPYTKMSGQSGVLMTACAFGKPVVSTSVGSFSEIVENNVTGIIVPPEDSKSLADAIIYILSNHKIRKQMGENMNKKASEFSWDKIAIKYMNIYNQIIDEKQS